MLILIDQIIHLILERVDNQVEFVSLINQLSNCVKLLAKGEVFTIQICPVVIPCTHLLVTLLLYVCELSLFFLRLCLQDIKLILEDLDTLSHLC